MLPSDIDASANDLSPQEREIERLGGQLDDALGEIAQRDQLIDEQRVELDALRAQERLIEQVAALVGERGFSVDRSVRRYAADGCGSDHETWSICVHIRGGHPVLVSVFSEPDPDAALEALRAQLPEALANEPTPASPTEASADEADEILF